MLRVLVASDRKPNPSWLKKRIFCLMLLKHPGETLA